MPASNEVADDLGGLKVDVGAHERLCSRRRDSDLETQLKALTTVPAATPTTAAPPHTASSEAGAAPIMSRFFTPA